MPQEQPSLWKFLRSSQVLSSITLGSVVPSCSSWPLLSGTWSLSTLNIFILCFSKLSKENSSTSSRPVETKVTHPRRQVGFYRMMSSMASRRTYQNFAFAILRSWRYAPARVEGTVESSRAYDVDRASTASARSQSAKNGVHSSQPARLLDGWW
jgi:hypothetical protein